MFHGLRLFELSLTSGPISEQIIDADLSDFLDQVKAADSEILKSHAFAQVVARLPPRFTVQGVQP